MRKIQHPEFGIASILVFGAALFVVSTIVVFAQDFIEPSGQAPTNNVVDFITVSDSAQARVGQLRINSTIDDIPETDDPIVDVIGNSYLQGDVTFGKNWGPSLFVNATKFPYYVTTGTGAANGKLSVNATTSYGLFASSLNNDGIYVNTKSAGTALTPSKNIFGQTTQVSAGEQSAGVMGVSINPLGYGIYAEQTDCTSYNFSCGFAGQFYGNVVVTGKIIGDGRGIFKTWTLNDNTSVDSATGISIKTITITNDNFSGGNNYVYANAIGAGETFISMSVLNNSSAYNPHLATLSTENTNLLSFSINNATGDLIVTKHTATAIAGPIVVTIYYHQQLSASVAVNEDIDGNGSSPDVANPYNALVGEDKVTTFIGALGGGGYEGSNFVWELYEDIDGNLIPDKKCSDATCGTVLIGIGETTSYVAPSVFPSSGKRVWLRASWTSDATVYVDQQIDLYKVDIINTPADNYVTINGAPHDFNAVVDCPLTACPSVEWALGSSFGGNVDLLSGLYTPPIEVAGGNRWRVQIKATLPSLSPQLEQTYEFDLLPYISITATLEGENLSSQGPWSVTETTADLAQVGISCPSACGVGQKLKLTAVAGGIPLILQHDFSWSINEAILLSGENLVSGNLNTITDATNQDIIYTAPSTYNASDVIQAIRTIKATWRFATEAVDSVQSQVMDVALGKGTIPMQTFSQYNNKTGSYTSFKIYGYASLAARSIYQVCNNLTCTDITQIINWDDTFPISITVNECGTLRITGVTGTNPQTIIFSYTGAGSGTCSDILYLRAMGDTRAMSQIATKTTLDPCPYDCSLLCPGFKCPTCCGTIILPGE